MKVKHLIKELQKCDQELQVIVEGCDCWQDSCFVEEIEDSGYENTLIVIRHQNPFPFDSTKQTIKEYDNLENTPIPITEEVMNNLPITIKENESVVMKAKEVDKKPSHVKDHKYWVYDSGTESYYGGWIIIKRYKNKPSTPYLYFYWNETEEEVIIDHNSKERIKNV